MTSGQPTPPPKPSGGETLIKGLMAFAVVGIILAVVRQTSTPATTAAPTPSAPADAVAVAPNTLVDWDEDTHPGSTTYSSAGLTLTLEGRAEEGGRRPVLTVRAGGPDVYVVPGELAGGRASAQLGVGRFDPSGPAAQVIFTTFTGGAHCCADIRLIVFQSGAWRTVLIGGEDGDRLAEFPKDLDGDGQVEIKLTDDAFLYAFASYAESYAPPRLLNVRAGVVHDVSSEPRFGPVYAAEMARLEPECRARKNGACAAYAAVAARAGKIDVGWPVVLDAYDPQFEWQLPTACRVDDSSTTCPDGEQVVFETFPEALRWFLGANGYGPAVYIARSDATGPSFECGTVTAETLQLVCAMPELAKADRQLAEAYGRAMALSKDPGATRAAEAEFIRTRNNAPPDAFVLLRLYQARIAELEGSS